VRRSEIPEVSARTSSREKARKKPDRTKNAPPTNQSKRQIDKKVRMPPVIVSGEIWPNTPSRPNIPNANQGVSHDTNAVISHQGRLAKVDIATLPTD
ncbi:hypothetical protein N9A70_05490, partial [Akkermansiaceae bacterium]|nr:hypothetical protein [Akkermansiaceae bacterium]